MALHPARVARDAAKQRVLDLEREVDQFPLVLHDIRTLGVKMTTQHFSLETIAAEVSSRLKKAGLTKRDLQSLCRTKSRLDEAEQELDHLEIALRQVEMEIEAREYLARQEARQPLYELCELPRRVPKHVPSLAHRFTRLRGRWD